MSNFAKSIPQDELAKRKPLRRFMQWLSKLAFAAITRLEIEGIENFPEHGPLIMVGNHFSFIDPAAFVRLAPYPIEFVGGAVTPHAPKILEIIPRLWGYLPVYRGTGSRFALKEAAKVLKEGKVLAIFPEGGSWAEVLRPARPGTAYLAVRSKAKVVPIGLVGLNNVFPSLAKFKRAKIKFVIGKPIGPFETTGRGRDRREQLDEFGHEIMRSIAELLPEEKKGFYSEDPAIREAAKGTEIYPWDEKVEGEVEGDIH
jgi:1-acyl-sn-glycerol-3-phosphate acyltransferase